MTNNDSRPSVSNILLSGCVRYEKLSELMSIGFFDSNARCINVYIDLYSICKALFSDSCRTEIVEYNDMAETILEMCGHYRSFFKRRGVHSRIFLIFGYDTSEIYRELVPTYNETFNRKSKIKNIRAMVDNNAEILQLICQLIYDVYFLKTDFEPATVMDYLMLYGDKNPNLIISKDIYPAQLTYLHPNTGFIRVKKWFGEDLSEIIPPNHHMDFFGRFWKIYCDNTHVSGKNINIDPCNVTLLSALNRFPERDMGTMYNIRKANNMIAEVVHNYPTKISLDTMMKMTSKASDIINPDEIRNRQNVLDVEYFRERYNDSIESKTMNFTNINDPRTLTAMCDECFPNNPIDITRF